MKPTYFYHGTTRDNYRFTLAGRIIRKEKETDDDRMILGIAICSSSDQFVKKTGRKKAEGRIDSKGLKGCDVHSMYSPVFYAPEEPGRCEAWFEGKEISSFLKLAKDLDNFKSSDIKKLFKLDNQYPF